MNSTETWRRSRDGSDRCFSFVLAFTRDFVRKREVGNVLCSPRTNARGC